MFLCYTIEQNFSDWTTWTSGCSPTDSVQQTRQRTYIPCDQPAQCEPNCTDIVDTRLGNQIALQINIYVVSYSYKPDQLTS